MGNQEHMEKFKKSESRPMAIPAKNRLLRRAAQQSGPLKVPPIVQEVLRSPGQPLEPHNRAFFEPRFEHDFSQVRIHTDSLAAESAREVNALAIQSGGMWCLEKDNIFLEQL